MSRSATSILVLSLFFRATVYGRLFVLLSLTAFVLMGFAPPILILFGVIDFAAARGMGSEFKKGRAIRPPALRRN